MLPWLSSLWLAPQKKRKNNNKKNSMQFVVFVFVEAQEANSQGNFQCNKCDGDCIFL